MIISKYSILCRLSSSLLGFANTFKFEISNRKRTIHMGEQKSFKVKLQLPVVPNGLLNLLTLELWNHFSLRWHTFFHMHNAVHANVYWLQCNGMPGCWDCTIVTVECICFLSFIVYKWKKDGMFGQCVFIAYEL